MQQFYLIASSRDCRRSINLLQQIKDIGDVQSHIIERICRKYPAAVPRTEHDERSGISDESRRRLSEEILGREVGNYGIGSGNLVLSQLARDAITIFFTESDNRIMECAIEMIRGTKYLQHLKDDLNAELGDGWLHFHLIRQKRRKCEQEVQDIAGNWSSVQSLLAASYQCFREIRLAPYSPLRFVAECSVMQAVACLPLLCLGLAMIPVAMLSNLYWGKPVDEKPPLAELTTRLLREASTLAELQI